MTFQRIKLIGQIQEKLLTSENQLIWLKSENPILIENILREVMKDDRIANSSILVWSAPELRAQSIGKYSSIFIHDRIGDFSEFRTIIESYSIDSRIIYCSSNIPEDMIHEVINIGEITFREYREFFGHSFQTSDLLSGSVNIEEINTLRDEFLRIGSTEINIRESESIIARFEEKRTIIESELFKKEHEIFREFMTNLALGVWDLYKEERIAKEMNISRRKVRKYTELLLKHNMIRAIGPMYQNKDTEMTRHVKVYFEDLADYSSILWNTYGQWYSKKWVIENFVYHELRKKLDTLYEIRFYKKKSGAELPFILIHRDTGMYIPIEIHLRSTGSISQALKTFYESYGSMIEYSMILNEGIAEQKEWNGSRVLVLPTIAL